MHLDTYLSLTGKMYNSFDIYTRSRATMELLVKKCNNSLSCHTSGNIFVSQFPSSNFKNNISHFFITRPFSDNIFVIW